jgi:hypothetical protein
MGVAGVVARPELHRVDIVALQLLQNVFDGKLR